MKRNNIPLNITEKSKSRASLIASIATLLVLCLLAHTVDKTFVANAQKAAQDEAAQQEAEALAQALEASKVSATILAVGDNYYQENLLNAGRSDSGTWNYDEVYAQVQEKISSADLAIVQQPTILTTNHDMVSGSDSFAAPVEVGDALVQAGFDVVASAGSHSDDYGVNYLEQTLEFWSQKHSDITLTGLHSTQEDADTIKVRDVNGIQIAFLNYSFGSYYDALPEENSYMIDYFQKEKVADDIAKAREISDCIFVMAQWGEEGNALPNEYEKQWTQFLLSQGVKVVLGGHPHVIQPYEILTDDQGNEMLVYYSLGNFTSSSSEAPELLGGMAEFTLEKTEAEGNVQVSVAAHTMTPTIMHYNSGEDVYQAMLLTNYTDEMASAHTVSASRENPLTVNSFQNLFDQITSMSVVPSTGTDLLDLTYQADGSMVSADGTITKSAEELASQYPADTSGSIDALDEILRTGSSGASSGEDTSTDSDSGYNSDSGYSSGWDFDSDSSYDSGYNSDYDSDSSY